MDTTTFIRSTMIASLSIFTTNSTESTTLNAPHICFESYIKVKSLEPPTSTRSNIAERFSLEQLKFNKKRLETFRELPENWNGYNSQKLNSDLIALVTKIISNLEYQPQIFPTGRGSIQLEKHIDENNFVEIEISYDDIFAYKVINGSETEESISFDRVNAILNSI